MAEAQQGRRPWVTLAVLAVVAAGLYGAALVRFGIRPGASPPAPPAQESPQASPQASPRSSP